MSVRGLVGFLRPNRLVLFWGYFLRLCLLGVDLLFAAEADDAIVADAKCTCKVSGVKSVEGRREV